MNLKMHSSINVRSRTIKYLNNQLGKILIVLVAVGIGCLTTLLIVEYRFFKRQAAKMMALKEDYNNHLVAVSKVLAEYNKTKERLEQLELVLEREKKKSAKVAEALKPYTNFPAGSRVYSSDDIAIDAKDSFITINREPEHLKQTSLSYLKEQQLDAVAQRIDPQAWNDYTDQELAKNKSRKTAQKKRKRRKRRVVSGSRQSEKATSYAREMARKEQAPQDIEFTWPIKRSDFWLSSFFGPRKLPNGRSGFHSGLDLAAVRGTPVHPVAPGVVVEARYAPGYGKTVVIAHNRKYRTRYAHLDAILVKVGQKLTRSNVLGRVGSTGHVVRRKGRDGSHLHLEVSAYGKKVNPLYFFN